jgi:hypothetical protein
LKRQCKSLAESDRFKIIKIIDGIDQNAIPDDEALAESDRFKVIKIEEGIDQNAILDDEALADRRN